MCPRCKAFYCGVECYKEHREECTEGFYKQNVEQHLKNIKASPETIRATKRVLERVKASPQYEETLVPDQEQEEKQEEEVDRLEEVLALLKE